MKHFIIPTLVTICLLSIPIAVMAENPAKVILSEGLSKDATLIDVRSAEEFKSGHLKNAINIPHKEISKEITKHVKKKDAKIVLYCKRGVRAEWALKDLKKLGYTKVTNAGGYDDLKDE